jgi:hypothetical protein
MVATGLIAPGTKGAARRDGRWMAVFLLTTASTDRQFSKKPRGPGHRLRVALATLASDRAMAAQRLVRCRGFP